MNNNKILIDCFFIYVLNRVNKMGTGNNNCGYDSLNLTVVSQSTTMKVSSDNHILVKDNKNVNLMVLNVLGSNDYDLWLHK